MRWRRTRPPVGRRTRSTGRRSFWARPLVLSLLAGVLLLGAGVYVLGFTSVLSARTLEVTGIEGEGSRGIVADAAALELGGPLARVDTAALHERVDSLVWVREVSVSRGWTSGAVTIDVSARTADLVLRDPEGQLEVADADGVAFRSVDKAPADLPVFDLSAPEAEPVDVAAALATWRGLPEDLRASIVQVDLDGDALRYVLEEGPTVVWGEAGQVEAKGRVVTTLLGEPQVEQAPDPAAVEIDVSVAGTPVLRGGAIIEPED